MRTGLLALLLVVGAAHAASAQYLDDPRSIGMGGAVRGDPVSNSALTSNPAGMARGYQYSAEAEYYRVGPVAGPEVNLVGASVVDSKTQPKFAVGIAYAYQFTDSGEAPLDGHDARMGFATPLVPNELSVGVGLRYLHIDRGDVGDLKGFTLDAGLVYSPSGNFNIGLVGNNLINRDDPAVPRMAGGGVSYTGAALTAVVDVMADFDTAETVKPIVSVGLEAVLAESVPVRLGFNNNQATEQNYLAGGVGFMGGSTGEASQLSLSYRQNLELSDDYLFAVGLSLFL